MLAIRNVTVLTPLERVERGVVVVDGGRVVAVDLEDRLAPGDRAAAIDAGGGYVVPGFIDVHVHGGGGHDFMDATPEAVRTITRFHATGGTAGLLATTASASHEDLLRTIQVVQRCAASTASANGAAILGIHLEGPYFALSKRGCHLAEHIRLPDPDEYEALLERGTLIRWMTLAPEVEGALELVRRLAARGIVASAGHTEAAHADVLAAVRAGLRHATHLYCAMSTIVKEGPRRVPGLLETTLASDELSTELIADGHHLHPALLRLAVAAKGPDRLCLVTDAMRAAGMPDGVYTFGGPDGAPAVVEGGVARTPDNTGFASSTARMHELVRNMVRLAVCTLAEAVQMASLTPARLLGLDDHKGSLVPGNDADLVVLDRDLDVRLTMVGGQIVYQAD